MLASPHLTDHVGLREMGRVQVRATLALISRDSAYVWNEIELPTAAAVSFTCVFFFYQRCRSI